jgi:hypothetical protein
VGAGPRCAVGGDLLLNAAETLSGCSCRGFSFFAAARGLDKTRIERAHVACGRGGFRAQPFGPLRFSAAITIGLSGRALGLGFRRPEKERKHSCRTCDESAGAFCASCHSTTTISSGNFSPGDTE